MNTHYDDFHLCPPSPDGQHIFRRSTDLSTTTNYHRPSSVKYPRKKRTKMLLLNPISNPNITPPCSECGKKFWSWKALFGHMRCHPERQWRGINPPPNFNKPDDLAARMTHDDHHVAICLLMLANAPISSCDTVTTNVSLSNQGMGFRDVGGSVSGSGGSNCRFECSSCKKVFGSHQALGGHRASHKNVKGCFAIKKTEGEEDVVQEAVELGDDQERNINSTSTNINSNTIATALLMPISTHQCSICLRVFSSGQALGGHMRCHWEKLGVNAGGGLNVGLTASSLDLNMPAPGDDPSSSVSYSSNPPSLDLRLGL